MTKLMTAFKALFGAPEVLVPEVRMPLNRAQRRAK